jgi:hypothetical protein
VILCSRWHVLNILWVQELTTLPQGILHLFWLYCNVVQFLEIWQSTKYGKPIPAENQ